MDVTSLFLNRTEKRKRNKLVTEFSTTDLKFTDLSACFDQATEQLFYKTDTHWNQLGAYYGYLALIKTINAQYPDLKPLEMKDFTKAIQISYQMDLAKLLNQRIADANVSLNLILPCARKVAGKLKPPEDHKGEQYEYRFSSDANNLKILVFRDSFSFAMMKFVAENFGESVFVTGHKIDKEIVANENPDIVVVEIVERNLDFLLR